RLTIGTHQRRSELVQPAPRRLVGAEAQDALQFLGRDAVAPRGDLEHRPEPHLERLPGLLQQRARRQARLVVAVAALEQKATALGPHALAAAARACRLAAPARLNPIGAASFLGRKPLV